MPLDLLLFFLILLLFLINILLFIFILISCVCFFETYPVQRILQLIVAISRDVCSQMTKILGNFKIMTMPWADFVNILDKCQSMVWAEWKKQFQAFRDRLRQTLRNRDRTPIHNATFEHQQLAERLQELLVFRTQHQKLQEVIQKTLLGQDNLENEDNLTEGGIKEINNAYQIILEIDVLDLSKEGGINWENGSKAYDQKVDHVEGEITSQLRDKLASASNANEMFRVFAKFNALFCRPRIRGAIQEYQNQLLTTVKKDIERLREKFIISYHNTQASSLNKLRDIRSVSGKIIWAKQIERKLKIFLTRVKDVLGPNWEQYPEGNSLRELGDTFLRHLNMKPVIERWKESMKISDFRSSDNIFKIVQKRDGLELVVNYDEKFITLFKEARNLINFGYSVCFFF